MGKVIKLNNKKTVSSKQPEWTPEEIKAKIQPYIDYLNKPVKVYTSKTGSKWSAEEKEQLKQLVFKYTCECYSCTAMAEELKKYFPWRSIGSLLGKISEIRQNCYSELEKFYTVVSYGGVVVRDAECHYDLRTGKVNFGSYFDHRILQIAGLIDGPKTKIIIPGCADTEDKQRWYQEIQDKVLTLFDFQAKKGCKKTFLFLKHQTY